jgi:hypothetical protein
MFIYKKICDFCLECRPSAKQVYIEIDTFNICKRCESKLKTKECDFCDTYRYIFDNNINCIHCFKYFGKNIPDKPIR